LWNREPRRKQWLSVVLYEHYLGRRLSQVERAMSHKLRLFSSAGESYQNVEGSQIEEIEYYEERMGKKAAQEMRVSLADLSAPGHRFDLSDPRWAEAAERAKKILSTAIDEHDSAVQRRLRRGLYWDKEVRQPLVQARLNLQLAEVDQLIKKETLQQAEVECDRLRNEIGRNDELLKQIRERVEEIVAIRARAALALEPPDYATVRQLFEQLSTRYPGVLSGPVKEIQEELAAKATELTKQAESKKDTAPREAVELLRQASAIWPRLSSIGRLKGDLTEEYPILSCAYSELPRKKNLSPMTARSPVERHAVSLMFESLVRWVDDPRIGAHYACQLADGLPEPLVRGRHFKLLRTDWSDSSDTELHICLGEDVRRTLEILTDKACPGHSPAWSGLLAGVDLSDSDDPYRVKVHLELDHWQPMSLMDFKILPSNSFRGTDAALKEQLEQFSQSPVGTGAYRLAEHKAKEVRFEANPYYRVEGLPKIREIIFLQMEALDAKEPFQRGEVDLIYGVQPEHVTQLTQFGETVRTLKTPTVTFLAPNYRRELLQNENVRLAIAHAIDRKAILDQYFRPGGREKDHAEITGPYPKFAAENTKPCWAYNTAVADFKPDLAKAYAEKACEELDQTSLKLKLIYPSGRPDVENACTQIIDNVKQKTSIEGKTVIELKREPVDPSTFYDRVTNRHDFDLAYWSHTFEDSTYWLEPLLDEDPVAQQPGGLNFMGYADDDLAQLFWSIRRHKQFRR
ncbi:MAG: ABC transporter substrate-binding protein, partial [Planctomycetes bacterium]|nr:ABC transporter substrate-binding protein [Planctomycetota bacterium]